MPRIPRTPVAVRPDWRKALGLFLLGGGALVWMGDLLRSMGSS